MKNDIHLAHLFRQISWSDLDLTYIKKLVEFAREEDICGLGLARRPEKCEDITTMTLAAESRACADLVARRDMVVCGVKLVHIILDVYSHNSSDTPCKFIPRLNDGDFAPKGSVIGHIEGGGRIMLQAERIMLNFLQRLSGVATETAKYVKALGNSKTKLLDTRKTTPCFRALEKYAFACGGGFNHRMGLFDRVMLKDNHLVCAEASAGDALTKTVEKVRQRNPNVAIEVEVDRLDQIQPVLKAGADVIMLDNFSLDNLAIALDMIGDEAWTEASGGVNLDTLANIGKVAPDFVSSGAPIHSSIWIDIGLDS